MAGCWFLNAFPGEYPVIDVLVSQHSVWGYIYSLQEILKHPTLSATLSLITGRLNFLLIGHCYCFVSNGLISRTEKPDEIVVGQE